MFQFEIKVGYVHNMCNTTKYTYKMNPFDIVLFIFNDSLKLDVQMMNLTEFDWLFITRPKGLYDRKLTVHSIQTAKTHTHHTHNSPRQSSKT